MPCNRPCVQCSPLEWTDAQIAGNEPLTRPQVTALAKMGIQTRRRKKPGLYLQKPDKANFMAEAAYIYLMDSLQNRRKGVSCS